MSARRSPLRRRSALALAGGILAVAGLTLEASAASASHGPPDALQPNPAVTVPLSGSVTGTATTWATVLMGKNDGDFDLFWQLFALDPTNGRAALVTPLGVADNGGLMVSPDPAGTTVLVGIGASQGLKFSPLAQSVNSGKSWSPGGLPDALVAAPSAVALGANGSAVALVGGTSTSVLERSGSLTSWRVLATSASLGRTQAGTRCAIGSLEAVALDATTPLVGASCREPDAPGVFVDSGSGWQLADLPVPNALTDDVFTVLRLEGTSALLAAVHKGSMSLIAAWEPQPGHPWLLSSPLPLGNASDLLASGAGPGTTQFVLVRGEAGVHAEVVSASATGWHGLPYLPKGVATIAFMSNGRVEALGVDDTKLSVFRLDTGDSNWMRTQTLTVPIVFGSSA